MIDKSKGKVSKSTRRVAYGDADSLEVSLISKAATGRANGGFVEGYASVWDNIDLQHEIVRKGCYIKSIEETVKKGNVPLMVKHFGHGGDIMECVGVITKMREDDYGLWFRANFLEDEVSQSVRQKVKQIGRASIGFMPVKWNFLEIDGRTIIEHVEAKISEVTITLKPANELAVLTRAKSTDISLLPELINAVADRLDGANEDEKRALAEASRSSEGSNGDDNAGLSLAKALSHLSKTLQSSSLLKEQDSPEEPTDKSKNKSVTLAERKLKQMKMRLRMKSKQ